MKTREDFLAAGIPPELVEEIMGYAGSEDPESAGSRLLYSDNASLGKCAREGRATSMADVLAQGIAGGMSGYKERMYADALRNRARATGGIRRSVFDADRRRNRGDTMPDLPKIGGAEYGFDG